jgi:hypothetical protein
MAERRFTKGLACLIAYTYSHSLDNVPTQQGVGSGGPVPQDIRYRFLDRGSSFDIRQRTSQSVIAGAAWATPLQYTYGRGGRNTLRGPHPTNFDGSLFNALNLPQFDLPNAAIESAAAGVISSTVGSPRDFPLSPRLWF